MKKDKRVGHIFPYKIMVDKDLLEFFKRAKNRRLVHVPDRDVSKRITCDLKPIREHIFLGQDRRYHMTYFGLKENIELDLLPRKSGNGFNAVFKKIF